MRTTKPKYLRTCINSNGKPCDTTKCKNFCIYTTKPVKHT